MIGIAALDTDFILNIIAKNDEEFFEDLMNEMEVEPVVHSFVVSQELFGK